MANSSFDYDEGKRRHDEWMRREELERGLAELRQATRLRQEKKASAEREQEDADGPERARKERLAQIADEFGWSKQAEVPSKTERDDRLGWYICVFRPS